MSAPESANRGQLSGSVLGTRPVLNRMDLGCSLFWFGVVFGMGATLGSAKGLFLALSSGVTPGGSQGTICGWSQARGLQGKLPP